MAEKRDPKITHNRGDCKVVERRQRAHDEYSRMSFADRIRAVDTAERETGKSGLLAVLDWIASRLDK